MSVAHIHFNNGTQHGSILRSALSGLEDSYITLKEIHGTLLMMIDGDGSSDTHFTYMTEKLGFTNNAGAKAAFDELASLLFKLSTNDSVSDVNAAMLQAFNKFR